MRAVIPPGSTTPRRLKQTSTSAGARQDSDTGVFAFGVAVQERLDGLTQAFVDTNPGAWGAVATALGEPFKQSSQPNPREVADRSVRIANTMQSALQASAAKDASREHIDAIWRHSLNMACAVQLVARERGQVCPLQAFVVGFVYDVGKIVLVARFPKAVDRVERAVRNGDGQRCEVEQRIFGIDHITVRRHLMKRWSLPDVGQPPHPSQQATETESDPFFSIVTEARALLEQVTAGAASDQGAVLVRSVQQIESRMSREEPASDSHRSAGEPVVHVWASDAQPASSELNADIDQALRQIVQFPTTASSLDELCGETCSILCDLFGLSRGVVFVESEPGRYRTCMVRDPVSEFQIVIANGSQPSDACEPGFISDATSSGHAALADRFVRSLGPGTVGCFAFGNEPRPNSGLLFALEADRDRFARFDDKSMQVLSLALETVFQNALLRRELVTQSDDFKKEHIDNQRAHSQKVNAASIERVARMAAGAAHEFNNPLAIIAGRAQMLQADVENASIRSDLELIISQAQRAGDMVEQLMDYARPKRPEPVEIRLLDWANRLRQYWYRQSDLLPQQVRVEIGDPRITVFADDRQLWEAASAIIENAIEAMRNRDGQLDEFAHIQINSPSTSTDDTIVVAICDNGRGMSPHVCEHALDPFFSHRAAGRGQGLGLSRAARYIEINGGRLWIESTEGKGTTVRFTLRSKRN